MTVPVEQAGLDIAARIEDEADVRARAQAPDGMLEAVKAKGVPITTVMATISNGG